ncbi:MAG: hypothetical protein ACOCTS_00415 [Thermodesulfobacteriota bacterium]
MTDKDAAAFALMAVFPSLQWFSGFQASRENRSAVQSLTHFAFHHGLIDAPETGALERYIETHAREAGPAVPMAEELDFEALFEQKETLLEFRPSIRALTERINALLARTGIELPRVSNSMLSRLKKEAADTLHKQNVLRSLAFWIGHERPHLAWGLNYEALLQLCRDGRPQVEYKEGVRIGFALYSRGDVIDHDIVGWLRQALKDYIATAVGRFAYGRWGKVRAHDITTLYVDFPKEEAAANPAAYRQCLRSAVSLAHQIAIRWALSRHCTQTRFLSIGIAAGSFSGLDAYLLPVLNTKLAGDPVIRLTDYARECVLINDIRARLCRQPAEITLFSGETLTVWWIDGFWSTLYFDFVPDLLDDPILGNDAESAKILASRLWLSAAGDTRRWQGNGANAVSTFLQFPHNSLLGLEIAKTLYYRRRFWEAIEILRIVLSLDPDRLNARTLRMVLLRNLAVDAPAYGIAEGMFAQAYQEAEFIQKNCDFESEDFYCEYAVVHLAQAMVQLRCMRQGRLSEDYRQPVMACLDRAEALFGMGMTVSPTGIRAIYLLSTVRILKSILQQSPRVFAKADRPLHAGPETIEHLTREFHWQLGYIRDDLFQTGASELLEQIFENYMVSHDDSIALQAYRPTTYFCSAVAWWDFFPFRTAGRARKAIELLNGAADMAAGMAEKNVCIYAFTRTYGEMLPAREFIGHIHRGIGMIREQAGDALCEHNNEAVIAPLDPGRLPLLMTVNY